MGTGLRLLFLLQNFRQGWGGAPESVRLMANYLSRKGIDADVFDEGFICRDVGRLGSLPEPGALLDRFMLDSVSGYDAILLVGPWQNPLGLRRVFARRRKDQPVYYLPRGGLANIEFKWPRGPKKFPYFFAVERRFMDAASGMIFSSTAEQRETIPAALGRKPEHIIPDFVCHAANKMHRDRPEKDGFVTFGFLAEISLRKGLLPLVEAFVQWVHESNLKDRVRLVIGGGARPGSEHYLEEVMAVLHANCDLDVEHQGPISHSGRDGFYSEIDVMVVPTLFESYGLTVIEALTAGCVLLVTPKVGILEAIPAHESVIRASGADVWSLKVGLKDAYRAAKCANGGSRTTNMEFWREVANGINNKALDAWSKLL